MKSIIIITLASVLAVGGTQVVASPADNMNLLTQPDVKLLSAKIENAIADLPETRTKEGIQNATYFVLAKQDASLDVKVAAVDSVIIHARLIDDQQIVDALDMIDLGADEVVKPEAENTVQSVSVPDLTASIPAPPSTVSKGGSDY